MFSFSSKTSCAACTAAATICPRPPQVVTWTATQSFQLWGHRAFQWCRSSYRICLPNLTLVGLPVPNILIIIGHGVMRSGDLDLWPFDLETGGECQPWHGQPSCHFWCFCNISLSIYGQTCIRWRHDLITLTFDLWRHRACPWCGSWYSIPERSLEFVDLPLRKI